MILSRLRVFWVIFYLHLKQIAVNNFFIFGVVVQPIIMALLAIYLLRDTDGFQAIYVIVGSVLTGLWTGTLFFCAFNVEGERRSGTLEEIVASPTRLEMVVISKTLANISLSISSMLFSYPLAAFLFGYRLTVAHPFHFSVSLVLTVLTLISLGMVIAPIMSVRMGAGMWVNALEMPMYIFGGFLFPIALLPGWATPVSYALAPYWAARALHGTSSGGLPLSDVYVSWAIVLGFNVVYWFLSAWLFRILLRRAREDATLGMQ